MSEMAQSAQDRQSAAEYARLYARMNWDVVSYEDRLDIIFTEDNAASWYDEGVLEVLAHFRGNPPIWGKIIAVWTQQLRQSSRLLQAAVDAWLTPVSNGVPKTHSPDDITSPQRTVSAVPKAYEPWRDHLLTTKQGDIKETVSNISLILQNHPAWQGKLWWDEVRGIGMIDQMPLSDAVITEIAQWLGIQERMPVNGLRNLERCVLAECLKHPRDLLKAWLVGLPAWDEVARLNDWLSDVAETPKTVYGMAVSRILPLSMVARAIEPGCLYRYVVILEGPEEARKSSLVHALAGEGWYVDLSLALESKESHMMLQGAWVAEMPELDSLSRTEETRLKAFITLKEDSYVPKYSNHRISTPRRTIFVGTTNEESYLKGQTGNTRFLPIKVGSRIDIEAFALLRDQLFAEALVWYQEHREIWWQLPEEAQSEARHARDVRRVVNVYEQDLGEWLTVRRFKETRRDADGFPMDVPMPGETTWPEIARWYLKLDSPERWKDMLLQKQIAGALKALGWENQPRWDPHAQPKPKTVRVWCESGEGP